MNYKKEEIEELIEAWGARGMLVPPIIEDWLEMHKKLERVKELAFEHFGVGADVGVN